MGDNISKPYISRVQFCGWPPVSRYTGAAVSRYEIHNRPGIQYGPGLGKGRSASTNMSDLPMISVSSSIAVIADNIPLCAAEWWTRVVF